MSNRELKFMKNAKTLKNVKKGDEKETSRSRIENNVLNEEITSETISLPISKKNDENEEHISENDIVNEEHHAQPNEEQDEEKQYNDVSNYESDIQYVTVADICLKGKLFWIIIYRICMLVLLMVIIIILLSR